MIWLKADFCKFRRVYGYCYQIPVIYYILDSKNHKMAMTIKTPSQSLIRYKEVLDIKWIITGMTHFGGICPRT